MHIFPRNRSSETKKIISACVRACACVFFFWSATQKRGQRQSVTTVHSRRAFNRLNNQMKCGWINSHIIYTLILRSEWMNGCWWKIMMAWAENYTNNNNTNIYIANAWLAPPIMYLGVCVCFNKIMNHGTVCIPTLSQQSTITNSCGTFIIISTTTCLLLVLCVVFKFTQIDRFVKESAGMRLDARVFVVRNFIISKKREAFHSNWTWTEIAGDQSPHHYRAISVAAITFSMRVIETTPE